MRAIRDLVQLARIFEQTAQQNPREDEPHERDQQAFRSVMLRLKRIAEDAAKSTALSNELMNTDETEEHKMQGKQDIEYEVPEVDPEEEYDE